MNSLIYVAVTGMTLMFIYGIGVFAMCLRMGETLISAASYASKWLVAFSVSQFFGYLAITLH